ncbi:hypothetical protein B0H16DRAFT_1719427 [Mycena metata]|uniref:Uncharacterized protein n=1 Tax=Mycena metata TaxID=1033252 RepID=A0AAD7JG17_9AGAR|nr:hypothetical protein B0H16DRAFT_1719427 [Mycena metata]
MELLPLFGGDSGPPRVNWGHSMFSQLTHLEVQDEPTDSAMWGGLCQLPCLSHLCFFHINYSLVDHILSKCDTLRVLAVVEVTTGNIRRFPEDRRFVVVTMDDVMGDVMENWERVVSGGEDYWERAERFIQERKNGEIEASRYVVE